MVIIGMRDQDALQIPGGVAQAGHVAQDLLVAARQASVDQGQTIRINQQVGVGDGFGDEVDIRNNFHGSFLLLIINPRKRTGRLSLRVSIAQGSGSK